MLIEKNNPFVPDENIYFRLQNIDDYVFTLSVKSELGFKTNQCGCAQDISGLRVDPSQ